MGFMSINSMFRRRGSNAPPSNITPYYGVASANLTQAQKNGTFIKSLANRGYTPDRLNPSFTLSAPSGSKLTMYYAYPVSYGEATFTDVASNFQGGWDGAHGDNGNTLGPIIVPVDFNGTTINFYLYQTDWPELGTVEWKVT